MGEEGKGEKKKKEEGTKEKGLAMLIRVTLGKGLGKEKVSSSDVKLR